jgi:solute carrier family 10 (sodium/bile acid cotransporter), member 7
MSSPRWKAWVPDPYIVGLLATVAVATVLPCQGVWATVFDWIKQGAIVTLFFLNGAKLSREAVIGGLANWRLHLLVLACTYALFPMLGLVAQGAGHGWVNPQILAGVLFLCLLPSTVQSSIALTSVAGGNVAAAVCSASASNLIGILLTPALVSLLMGAQGGGPSLDAAESIVLQLILPFIAGHLSRPWTAGFLGRRKKLVLAVDRGSILLVVYTAFSAAVVEGLWRRLSAADLVVAVVMAAAILAVVLVASTLAARRLGFSKEDEIAIVFCGSKKSLASGVPMAGLLFPAAAVGPMIVPLMLFHQLQLMVCAVLAGRYARRLAQPVTTDA